MGVDLIYGFDALCGWCYGFVPAMRQVRADHPDLPVRLVLPGLVTGGRVGPYAEMEGYIRGASERLLAVTGRAPSEAFFELIRTPGVRGDSAPPTLALAAIRRSHPDRAIDLAHAAIEAHFQTGHDLNDPETWAGLQSTLGLPSEVPDVQDTAAAQAVWAEDRGWGISSFPTLIVRKDGRQTALPSVYDPRQVSDIVGQVTS